MGTRAPLLLCGLMLAFAPAQVLAQAKAPTPPSKAQLDTAAFNLKIIISALQSAQIEQRMKDALFGCLYENNLAKIGEATEKVLAANPGKIDKTNPSQMLGVIAGVCGYRPAAAPAPAKPR